MFRKTPKILYATLSLVALGVFSGVATADAGALSSFGALTTGLPERYANVFSQNNILFYNPCEDGVNKSFDSCFAIDNSVDAQDAWYAEGCLTKCKSSSYAHLVYDTANPFLRDVTEVDEELGGMLYIYAENYDINYDNYKLTPNGGNSTQKYYWIVLPCKAYQQSFAELWVATFENLDEPIYFITIDCHACGDQGEDYCGQAEADPDGVKIGKEFFGTISNTGNPTKVANVVGKLTSLCRLQGDKEPLVNSDPSKIPSTTSNSGSGTQALTTGSSSSSSSSNSSASLVTWQGGWITDGLEGYIKEPAEGSSYGLPEEGVNGGHTQDYVTDGKPNKILIHSTEGGPGDGSSGLALYGSLTKGGITGITPAHFTIDLQNKRVFQHFSIDKPSDAIIEDLSAGVQIEIIGFMNEGNDPALPNFSDADWDYLAELLIAISDQTGIKLESTADWTHTNRYNEKDFRDYTGVLGHMHAPSSQNHDDPGDIWSKIEDAVNRVRNVSVCSIGNSGDFASYVMDYAWTLDELSSMGATEWGGTLTPKPGYKEAYDRRVSEGKYVGSRSTYGDCGGFVTTLMNESGYEPRYDYDGKGGNTIYQERWMKENWELVGISGAGFDTSQLKQGDVYINDGHTFVFVGDIPGFGSDVASASWDTRVPQASGNSASESGYRVYRKK